MHKKRNTEALTVLGGTAPRGRAHSPRERSQNLRSHPALGGTAPRESARRHADLSGRHPLQPPTNIQGDTRGLTILGSTTPRERARRHVDLGVRPDAGQREEAPTVEPGDVAIEGHVREADGASADVESTCSMRKAPTRSISEAFILDRQKLCLHFPPGSSFSPSARRMRTKNKFALFLFGFDYRRAVYPEKIVVVSSRASLVLSAFCSVCNRTMVFNDLTCL